MTCGHCRDAADFFGERPARRDLRRYRRRGPLKTTRLLVDAIRERLPPDGAGGGHGAERPAGDTDGGFTVLDIGGGVGAVQHDLLEGGATRVVSVDASPAYLAAARKEAEERGHADRLEQRLGDFVELAREVGEADVVTLDRVICCYPDMPALVGASAERARSLYGVVIPREVWWMRSAIALVNVVQRLRRSDFRAYVHPTPAIVAEVETRGLRRAWGTTTFLWRVLLFERASPPTPP